MPKASKDSSYKTEGVFLYADGGHCSVVIPLCVPSWGGCVVSARAISWRPTGWPAFQRPGFASRQVPFTVSFSPLEGAYRPIGLADAGGFMRRCAPLTTWHAWACLPTTSGWRSIGALPVIVAGNAAITQVTDVVEVPVIAAQRVGKARGGMVSVITIGPHAPVAAVEFGPGWCVTGTSSTLISIPGVFRWICACSQFPRTFEGYDL